MEKTNINEAATIQLRVLLGLTPEEAQKIIKLRPFKSLFDLRRALPFRVARGQQSFEVEKLDLNSVTEDDLTLKAGIPAHIARQIKARQPFYTMNGLRNVPGVDESTFNLLDSLFAIPDLGYLNKLTGQSVSLAPDLSKVLVEFGQGEDATESKITRRLGLQRAASSQEKSGLQVFSVSQAEESADVISSLKQQPGVEKVVPAFKDQVEHQRFLDPEYLTVQFAPEVPMTAQEAIISRLRLAVAERHRTAGLYTLQIRDSRDDVPALLAAVKDLNSLPEVLFAEPNYLGFDDVESANGVKPDTESAGSLSWNLSLIDVARAWSFGKGSSDVVIAIIDTGVEETHPAIRDAILPRREDDDWNFVEDDQRAPSDKEGHGTFIAGVLVGNGYRGVQGICPGCRILPLKIPLSGQLTSYARRADAILYALDRVPPKKRLVINLSWKTTGDVAVIRNAIMTAVSRNAIVVASAGNSPVQVNEIHYPSDYTEVISVGAVGPDRKRASYSFYGDQVDLAAPGGGGSGDKDVDIVSAALDGDIGLSAGTSFAAPHVVGVAALILSRDPRLPSKHVRRAIESTTSQLAESGLGHGMLNAAAALASVSGGPEAPSSSNLPSTGDHLKEINSSDLEALVSRFGLLRITARLLISRRPFTTVEQLRGTTGLTNDQFVRISGGYAKTFAGQ